MEDKTPAINESPADVSGLEEIDGSVATSRKKRGIIDTANNLLDKLTSKIYV